MPRPPPLPVVRLRLISAHVRRLEDCLAKLGVDAELTEDSRAALHLAEFSLHIASLQVRHMVEPFPADERFDPRIAPAFAPAGLFAQRMAHAIEVVDGTNDKTTKQRAVVNVVRSYAEMIADGTIKTEELPVGWPQLTLPMVLQASVVAGLERFSVDAADGPTEQKEALARAAVEAWASNRREDLIWDTVNEFLAAFGLEAKTTPASERATWPKARQHKYTHPLVKLRIRIRRK